MRRSAIDDPLLAIQLKFLLRQRRRGPASLAASALGSRSRRTLLASTNPVHSLSGLLEKSVFGAPTAVVQNFWAYEIDTKETIERSKKEIREKIQWFLKFADISTKADDFVESATMNPAFEESAMFENMVDLMLRDDYDVYVFDTRPRPTPGACSACRRSIHFGSTRCSSPARKHAACARCFLSAKRNSTRARLCFVPSVGQARQRLTDLEKTAFFFVTLPEALPIAVVSRFIGWFQDFGIPVGGVIVNMLLDKEALGQDSPEFVLNRVRMQEEYLKTIWHKFDGSVRALIPLFDQELRGLNMLGEAAKRLMD
jgi:arsenite-transporting ATPase